MVEVKEKRVELIELFYDLIYVYAISRLTLMVEEPVGGIIPAGSFLRYFVICFVILQAWLYMTNYVNRYSRWTWWEYLLTGINMVAAVYMANTISSDWGSMAAAFNIAMFVMLLCVAVLYLVQTRLHPGQAGAAGNSLVILAIVLFLYAVASIFVVFKFDNAVIWMDIIAVLVGAFLPFFIRGRFDISVISFPHLMERFELLTIITFGEGIVGMTGFFDVANFSFRPVLIFAVILSLFGSYVVQIHYLCDHHRVERALRLMFSHYFIVIAVNLLTVAFKFLENTESDLTFTAIVMIVSLILFYVSIYADSRYYYEKYCFGKKDAVISAAAAVVGAAVIFTFHTDIYGFLFGVLIVTVVNFINLLKKYRTQPAEQTQREHSKDI